jgi:3'-phosphoadenosine 5'-phosphosulfate sulfotransferase (PAPS reductase)/FAD synthetase
MNNTSRIISWFSCGAASAIATKLAITESKSPVEVIYCHVKEEHPDNLRFMSDCEKWFGQKINVIQNEKYNGSIYEVFNKNKYIVGVAGAPCTRLLKKEMRKKFEKPGDRQVFGYTAEEQYRVDRFIDANNDVNIWCPLIDEGLKKEDCLAMLENANIELPMMYKLGYHNNNCIGCVKGGAGYWNKIRVDFPEHFDRMAKLERNIGACISKHRGERVYLDELPKDAGDYPKEQNIECSIFCQMAEESYTK